MISLIIVGLGGAIGSAGRYLVVSWAQRMGGDNFPWGTFAVNSTGSVLIGLLFGSSDGGIFWREWVLFLGTGILGGYTTFSTFSIENFTLFEQRRYGPLFLNVLGQLGLSLLGVAIGYWLGGTLLHDN